MHSTEFERRNTKSRAIEEALSRLGQPITRGAGKECCGFGRLRLQRWHVRAGRDSPAALRRHGARRRGWHDRDAAARGRCQGAARRGRISGASRSHQRTGSCDGGGRRIRFALAVRDRSSLGEPDQDGGIFAPAEQLRHDHAVRAALRTPSRRHPEYRPGEAQPRHPRPGRPAHEILARRTQALPDSVAYLFHGMLRHDRQRDHEGARAERAAHARPCFHLGMDRRAALELCSSRSGSSPVPHGCWPKAPTPP